MTRAPQVVGDVSALPDYSFGPTSLGWWGVVGFMLIEGMGFVLAIGAYYFLVHNEHHWPPTGAPPPLAWATALTALSLLSELPNVWLSRMAHAQRLWPVRIGLTLMTVLGLAVLALRGFEMHAMNARWDQTAYGSIVWALLVLHTVHMATDVFDSGVLAALSWFKPMDGRRYSDVADNALYWHFIVWSWVVLYGVIYWTPRWV
ncbi:MAG TPA: hypothetical protein VM687_07805 [Stenotrophomonas sp.]|nr:hypothetical protein [Stenotrophomonas sp.]